MVEAGPEGAARAVEHSYVYVVSEEFIQERIELDGVELPDRWSISFSLSNLPDPGTRARALALRGLYEDIGFEPELESPTDDPIEFLDYLEEWLAGEQERISYEEDQQRQAERGRERDAEEFDQAMDLWIEEHGSYRLKTARSKRYKITSSYARDRGRKELPGFWIDTAGAAVYRERVDPSEEALRVEIGVEKHLSREGLDLPTRIVWLVEPPSGLAEVYEDSDLDDFLENEGFPQQETILVSGYLGRYEAFLPVDIDERAPLEAEGEE